MLKVSPKIGEWITVKSAGVHSKTSLIKALKYRNSEKLAANAYENYDEFVSIADSGSTSLVENIRKHKNFLGYIAGKNDIKVNIQCLDTKIPETSAMNIQIKKNDSVIGIVTHLINNDEKPIDLITETIGKSIKLDKQKNFWINKTLKRD